MPQTAACNRHHTIDQQLCRLMLLTLDRLRSDELIMTQALIANMLRVRRESVTEALGRLDKAGLINYRRGQITALAREPLELRASVTRWLKRNTIACCRQLSRGALGW